MFRTIIDTPYVSLTKQNTKYIPTGVFAIDYAHNDLQSGTVTIITGSPGGGKSTFVHSIILGAIDRRIKTLLVDGEHDRDKLLNNLFSQTIGSDKSLYNEIICNKRIEKEPKAQVQEMIDKWMSDLLTIYHSYESTIEEFDELFELISGACKAHGIDFVTFDNLMALVSSSQAEMNAKQSDFMKRCDKLAKEANVAVILVAHPNGTIDIHRKMSYYQISGTADLPNLASNIFQVVKDPWDENGNKLADGAIYDLKNRGYGEEVEVYTTYDKDTRSICEIHGDTYDIRGYNWRMDGTQEFVDIGEEEWEQSHKV